MVGYRSHRKADCRYVYGQTRAEIQRRLADGLSTKSGNPRPEPLEEQELHGLAGEFVRLVEPESEADPAA